MSEHVSNSDWPEIAKRLRAAGRVALCSHARPDGDAIGSMSALGLGLRSLGKTADIFVMGPVEVPLLPFVDAVSCRHVEDGAPSDDYDAIVVLDTGAWSQVEPIRPWLERNRDRVIVIDHHVGGDGIGALQIVEPGASAAAQMVVGLLDELEIDFESRHGVPLAIAEAVFLGVATDTGWFRFANAGPETLELGARLLRAGVDKSRLYERVEQTHRPERIAIEARALASTSYARDGRVAIQVLRAGDFAETGAAVDDLTGLVNGPMVVAAVRVSILLAETEPLVTKVSLRAKPSARAGDDETDLGNVDRLARRFGGGGHVLAAGARLKMGIDEARRAVLDVIEA